MSQMILEYDEFCMFLPWKNCRQLNLLTISPRKESFPLQTLSLPVLFSFIQCLVKKNEVFFMVGNISLFFNDM